MVELAGEFRTTPLAYYVWSRSPFAAQVLAFAIGRFSDANFRWITVREATGAVSEEEPWVSRLLPPTRILPPLTEAELGRGPRVPRATFDAMIRPEGATDDRIAVNTFLLLPLRIQRILDEVPNRGGPRTVVLANTNRIREFYPSDPEVLRAYTEVFPRSGFSLITTSIPPPFTGRYAFNVVMRLDVLSSEAWREAQVVVEKGFRQGKFTTGASFPARSVPDYLEIGEEIRRAVG